MLYFNNKYLFGNSLNSILAETFINFLLHLS
jgi:hypothetical protein